MVMSSSRKSEDQRNQEKKQKHNERKEKKREKQDGELEEYALLRTKWTLKSSLLWIKKPLKYDNFMIPQDPKEENF